MSDGQRVLAGGVLTISSMPWASLWMPWVRFGVSASKVADIFEIPSILVFDRHKYICVPELYLPPMFNLASGGE